MKDRRRRGLLALAFVVLLVTASLPVTAGGPLILAGLGLLTVLIGLPIGVVTRRFAVARAGGWMMGLSMLAIVLGVFTCTRLERGDEATARQLIDAVERHHQATGRYPDSLDALAPVYLPAPPAPRPWQTFLPYYYRKADTGYELSYSVGFKSHRVYHSTSKSWSEQH